MNSIIREEIMNTTQEFIVYLHNAKEDISSDAMNLRELKAIYFTINLDYIRLCEQINCLNYLSSQNSDILIKYCTTDEDLEEARGIVINRIDDLIRNLK